MSPNPASVPTSTRLISLAALVIPVTKAEDHEGTGYHLHPMESGKRLRYKLLFDHRRGQDWLSWEDHGQGRLTWGDPKRAKLGKKRSKALHAGALNAVLRSGKVYKKGMSFQDWASKFEKPGRSAYVAAPAVLHPTQWPATQTEAKAVSLA